LNTKYPKNGECCRWSDKENRGKKRREIVELDIHGKELKGKLKLKGFYNLEILECDENELDELDISMCSKLKILNCGENGLEELNCSNNKKLVLIIC
jgi:Leucine-rich repeat (LRR) protein